MRLWAHRLNKMLDVLHLAPVAPQHLWNKLKGWRSPGWAVCVDDSLFLTQIRYQERDSCKRSVGAKAWKLTGLFYDTIVRLDNEGRNISPFIEPELQLYVDGNVSGANLTPAVVSWSYTSVHHRPYNCVLLWFILVISGIICLTQVISVS